MLTWRFGEKRYVYSEVTSVLSQSFTISSATYIIYNCSNESVVDSGSASIQDHIVYKIWEPTTSGTFVVKFEYTIGSEVFSSSQVIEVKETV
jgi:hypothetical protein